MGINIFRKQPPITGGNSLDTNENLKAQVQIDLANLEKTNKQIIKSLNNSLKDNSKNFITNKMIQPYYLLQYQANYFCNTIQFKNNSTYLTESIIKVIRAAFLFGRAGMFFDKTTNKIFPVAFVSGELDFYGNFKKVKLAPIDEYLSSTTGKVKTDKCIKIFGDECSNYAEFKWGSLALSAWITIWPFIQYQHMLLEMMVGLSFSYSKKYVYNVTNPSAITDELELFYNPTNFFIVNAGFSGDLTNKIKTLDQNTKDDTTNFLDYYNGVMNILYSIIGRRVNVDDKKERNITTEILSSQENYDILKREYLNQFAIFVKKFNAIKCIGPITEIEFEIDEPKINAEQNGGQNDI